MKFHGSSHHQAVTSVWLVCWTERTSPPVCVCVFFPWLAFEKCLSSWMIFQPEHQGRWHHRQIMWTSYIHQASTKLGCPGHRVTRGHWEELFACLCVANLVFLKLGGPQHHGFPMVYQWKKMCWIMLDRITCYLCKIISLFPPLISWLLLSPYVLVCSYMFVLSSFHCSLFFLVTFSFLFRPLVELPKWEARLHHWSLRFLRSQHGLELLEHLAKRTIQLAAALEPFALFEHKVVLP